MISPPSLPNEARKDKNKLNKQTNKQNKTFLLKGIQVTRTIFVCICDKFNSRCMRFCGVVFKYALIHAYHA